MDVTLSATPEQKTQVNVFFNELYIKRIISNDIFRASFTGEAISYTNSDTKKSEPIHIPEGIRPILKDIASSVAGLNLLIQGSPSTERDLTSLIHKEYPNLIPDHVVNGSRSFSADGFVFRGTDLCASKCPCVLSELNRRVGILNLAFDKMKVQKSVGDFEA